MTPLWVTKMPLLSYLIRNKSKQVTFLQITLYFLGLQKKCIFSFQEVLYKINKGKEHFVIANDRISPKPLPLNY